MTIRPTQLNNHSEDDLELLSAYLDDQLSSDERARLEQRLQAEPELHAELEELRATTTLLLALPAVIPPASCTRDPAQVQSRQPLYSWFTTWLRVGGALATVLVVLAGTLFINNSTSTSEVVMAPNEDALFIQENLEPSQTEDAGPMMAAISETTVTSNEITASDPSTLKIAPDVTTEAQSTITSAGSLENTAQLQIPYATAAAGAENTNSNNRLNSEDPPMNPAGGAAAGAAADQSNEPRMAKQLPTTMTLPLVLLGLGILVASITAGAWLVHRRRG